MSVTRSAAVKTVGVIFYGLVAGFVGTTIIVLGQILLAFFGVWFFHRLGWEQASLGAARFGFFYVYFIFIGLVVGIVICLRVWIKGFRNTPTPPSSGAM